MTDISNIGDIIRWPIELIGKTLNFLIRHFLEIGIVIGAIWFLTWVFRSGVIARIVEVIEENKLKKEKTEKEDLNEIKKEVIQ